MDASANVLRPEGADEQSFGPSPYLFGRVSNEDYRRAVSKIVKEIQLQKDLDDEQLAERLGCSEGTVANARNQRGNLDAVTMLNLGAMFGGEARLDRILALVNGAPVEEPSILGELDRAEQAINAARKRIIERDLG